MLHEINQIDLAVFHFFNAWAGNWNTDRLVMFAQQNQLFRGGIAMAVYWWFWFAGSGEARASNRQKVVAAVIGAFASLLLARALAFSLPFRMRPMAAAGSGFHPPGLQLPMDLEDWSSFPSDTAALFFALSFGAYRLSRPLGVLLMVHAAVWICLPRIYAGVHYPSDLVAGALVGVAAAALSGAAMNLREGAVGRGVMALVEAMERRWPKAFYAGGFLFSFEMAVMFDDLRNLARASLHGLHHDGYLTGTGLVVLSVSGAILAALVLCAVLALRRRPGQMRPRRSGGLSLDR